MHYHPRRPGDTPDGDGDHGQGELPEVHENYGPEAAFAVCAEAGLPTTKWEEEIARGLEMGLPGADSLVDERSPTFSRGELPHFAGINTFLEAPYLEDVTSTSGCTPRPGSTPRTSRTSRPRTSCRSASAAGRPRGRA